MSDAANQTQAPEAYGAFLSERRGEILQRVAQAAARSGRAASEVSMIAVSKTVDVPAVAQAWDAGWRAFGENRPQELHRKLEGIRTSYPQMADVRFDMIGNLQKNKVNLVLECRPALVHSVSSAQLAEVISRRAVARGIRVPCLLETNVSGEESKSGFSPDEVRAAAEGLCALPGLDVQGLMTMAPAGDPSRARATFSGLRELRDELRGRMGRELPTLSCGMSDDFPIAVEEGATLLRLGRIVFDPNHPVD